MPETKDSASTTDQGQAVRTVGEPQKKWAIVTSAQVERVYVVVADDAELAHQRLRQYLKDADALRPELVTKLPEEHNVTPEKVKGEIKRYNESSPLSARSKGA